MNEFEKKAVMLLKSLIFHYHGLDEEERMLLEKVAKKLNATGQMEWANGFIAEDYISSFERSRKFLKKVFLEMPVRKRVEQLVNVWNDCYFKGYLTEMETTAILTLSKDWFVEKDFLKEVQD